MDSKKERKESGELRQFISFSVGDAPPSTSSPRSS